MPDTLIDPAIYGLPPLPPELGFEGTAHWGPEATLRDQYEFEARMNCRGGAERVLRSIAECGDPDMTVAAHFARGTTPYLDIYVDQEGVPHFGVGGIHA